MLERIQLNLRLDGRRELLDAIKVAAAREGLSANAFIIKALEGATDTETATTGKKKQSATPAKTKSSILEVLDKPLDKSLELSSAEPLDKPLDKPLDTLRAENELLRQELETANKQLAERDKELDQLHARNGDLILQVQILESELEAVRTDRPEPENQSPVPAVVNFPESADILNELKGRCKKSKVTLRDVEILRGIMIELAER